MDQRVVDGASPGQRLGLPFKVDLETARARVVAHPGAGLLTPCGVRSAGSITSIKAIYVPARRVVAEAASNWTGESGSSSGKQIHWTAVSGQHRGAWSGPSHKPTKVLEFSDAGSEALAQKWS